MKINVNNLTDIDSNITVVLNGKILTLESSPYIENGVIMVPMRTIFEQLGADIVYDSSKKKITAYKNNIIIELTTNSNIARVNNIERILPVAVTNKGGYIMIPVCFVSEALGSNVKWDSDKRIVTID